MKTIKRLIATMIGPMQCVITNDNVSNITTLCGGLRGKYPTLKQMDHLIFRAVKKETSIRFPSIVRHSSTWIVHTMAIFEDAEVIRTTRTGVELPQEAIDVAIKRVLVDYRVEKAIKALHKQKRA